MDALPAPGDTLAGKYSVVRVIGRGGMGVVFEAMHLRLRQRVAIKMMAPDLCTSPSVVARFEREARAAAQLRSRHAVRVIDVDELPGGTPFMVMELLSGRDLGAEIEQRQRRIAVRDAVRWVLEACTAMAEAHALGIVHRDLKPGNLFLCSEGDQQLIKVLDFGISKVTGDHDVSVTTTAALLGTPLYMSPEQVRSAKNVDARSDIWALGVILYELVTGCRPFDGETATAIAARIVADAAMPARELRPDLPEGVARTIETCLMKDAVRRFPDVASLAAALAPFAPERRATEASLPHAATLPSDAPPSAPVGSVPTTAATAPVSSRIPGVRPLAGTPARWILAGLAAGGIVVAIWLLRAAGPEATPQTPSALAGTASATNLSSTAVDVRTSISQPGAPAVTTPPSEPGSASAAVSHRTTKPGAARPLDRPEDTPGSTPPEATPPAATPAPPAATGTAKFPTAGPGAPQPHKNPVHL